MLPPYLLFTVLAVQFIYILVNWYFFRQKEYLFYAIYIVALTAYFANKYLGDANGVVSWGSFSYNKLYVDKDLVMISFYCYFRFVVSFIDAKHRYPEIYRFMWYTNRVFLFYLIGNITLVYLTRNLFLENLLFFYYQFGFHSNCTCLFKPYCIKKDRTSFSLRLCRSMFIWPWKLHYLIAW